MSVSRRRDVKCGRDDVGAHGSDLHIKSGTCPACISQQRMGTEIAGRD